MKGDGWDYLGIAEIAHGTYMRSLHPEDRTDYGTLWKTLSAQVRLAWCAAVTKVIRFENEGDSLD